MAKHLCWQHTHGVEPGQAPTFEPSCTTCQALLAAGKRTGLEPRPGEKVKARRRVRMSAGMFERKLAVMATMRAEKVERPDPRNCAR